MKYYPMFLDLKGRRCLVVGGGQVAQRKVITLVECGAEVILIAPEVTDVLKDYVTGGRITHRIGNFTPSSLENTFMVIGATNDPTMNSRIAKEAAARGILHNIVDQPEDCSFILPSILARGDLTLAVSTAGRSPALAKKIRRQLEDQIGEEYGRFLEIMGLVRKRLLQENRPSAENKILFETLVESDLLSQCRNGDHEGIDRRLQEILGPDYTLNKLQDVCK
ncbi:MAG: bifunctional precorrin-2 dehydrogenase/sirohydrochlorin ferrochelatase [Deltaproteobacteria bacterium]|nr:bifunctional precorrin-2 dehydrogenase/sirohydrochlorin ferrochelatase [Deltaproteobacteria bacterium]